MAVYKKEQKIGRSKHDGTESIQYADGTEITVDTTTGLPTDYQTYIHQSRYARWLPEEGRREKWDETVQRLMEFWTERFDEEQLDAETVQELYNSILNLETMPSMRALMTAGEALERDNVAGFNCSYLPMEHQRCFDELAYVLLCGTGVGFSVEREFTSKLSDVAEEFHETDTTIVVPDSKVGWAKSYRQLVSLLYAGEVPKWDTSKVRGAGEPLKTFGGRASGPEPLIDLFQFTIEVFRNAAGRKLSSLEVHDLVCKVASVIVVGGVRRSALISLSDPDDRMMATCKSYFDVDQYSLINEDDTHWHYSITMKKGQATRPTYTIKLSKAGASFDKSELETKKKIGWWVVEPQRALANNSACYEDKPGFQEFYSEMGDLYASYSGERGMFSRSAARTISERNGRRVIVSGYGTNPCSEIILRPFQFCNLSEVVVRAEDTLDTLKEKVRKATILGTLQATLTDFRYLRSIWKKNTEEEALLGVSLTGIMDHLTLSGGSREESGEELLAYWLQEMKQVAIDTNKEWAEKLGINQSAAITCVKPSGTVSQLVDSASGIHPRFSKYYIRTVRADAKDPLAMYMESAGFPVEPESTNPDVRVFSFPVASPKNSVTVSEVGAMEQLRTWKIYQDHWCEHKPSITVYYTDDEFLEVASWMWKNFDEVSGISLLPYSEHTYKQAPYQECTEENYLALLAHIPEFDLEAASEYEEGVDSTTGSQELACVGGACEL